MLGRVLVGFDGSADADAAVRMAVVLAEATGAEVSVAAVVAASRGESDEDRRLAFAIEAEQLREQAAAAVAACRRAGVTGTVKVVEGDHPGRDLLALATRGAFDLVVVGRHGRERAMHGGPGRVARVLVEEGKLPVLVVSAAEVGGA